MTDVKMEWGSVLGVGSDWQDLTFQQSYDAPTICAFPFYNYTDIGSNSITADVDAVNTTGCKVRLGFVPTSASARDDIGSGSLYYVVVENTGTGSDYFIPGTTIKIEAGSFSDTDIDGKTDTNWSTDLNVTTNTNFTSNPLVFAQRTSWNETRFATTWVCDEGTQGAKPADGSLHIHFNCAEVGGGDFSSPEDLHYIVIDAGSGYATMNNGAGSTYFRGSISSDSIRGLGNSTNGYHISNTLNKTPATTIGMQLAMDGGDGGWLVAKNHSSSGTNVWSMEDTDSDTDLNHTTEEGCVLSFEDIGYYSETVGSSNVRFIYHIR